MRGREWPVAWTAVVLLAWSTWSAPAAHAVPARAGTATPSAVTSATWQVVVTAATSPPYAPGPAVPVGGVLAATQYLTVANTGTRTPSSVTYRLTAVGLSASGTVCATPWTAQGSCASTSAAVSFNSPQTGAVVVPAPGGASYLRLSVLVAGAGTLHVEAARPAPVTRND